MGQREHLIVVPPLVGLSASVAHDRALDARLLAVDQDPSHTPSAPGTVTAQEPAPGHRARVGQRIMIWVGDPSDGEDGGGGGGNQPLPTEPTPVAPAGTK